MLTNCLLKKPHLQNLRELSFFFLLATVVSLACGISLFEISSSVFVVLSLLGMIGARQGRVWRGRWMIFLCLYFLACILSFLPSEHWGDSLKGLFRVARLILLALCVIDAVDSEDRFRKVFWVYLFSAFAISLDGLFQQATGIELLRQRTMTTFHGNIGRITATFPQATDFSGYLSLAVFLFLGLILEGKKLKLKWQLFLFLALGCVTLFLCLGWTYSRGAWISVAITLLFLALIKRKKLLLGVWAGVLVWMIFFSPTLMRERIQSLWRDRNGTVTERVILMQESFGMIEESPWFGLGINTFSDNAARFKSKKNVTNIQYAHNGYLQMATEIGIVGLLSFLFLLAYVFLSAGVTLLSKKWEGIFFGAGGSALLFGVLAFLMHCATDTALHSLLLVGNLWLCLGLLLAAASRCEPWKFYDPKDISAS